VFFDDDGTCCSFAVRAAKLDVLTVMLADRFGNRALEVARVQLDRADDETTATWAAIVARLVRGARC
jgi:hypothetical protein